jgi:hypothetical protein
MKFQGIMPANKKAVNFKKSSLKREENTRPIIKIIINGLINVQQ